MTSPPFPNAPRPAGYRRTMWNLAGKKRNGVHYVGDEVAIEWDAFEKGAANFETGSNGTPITTSVDDGSPTPWSTVDISGGNSVTFSSTQAAHGSLSAKLTNGGSSGGPKLIWSDLGTSHNYYGRGYMFWPAHPANTWTFLAALAGVDTCWSMQIDSSGIIRAYDAGGGQLFAFSTAVATGQWVRLEYHADHASGDLEAKLFNVDPDSGTATETHNGNAVIRDDANQMSFSGGHLGDTMYWDDIVAFATSYPGPYSVSDSNPNPTVELTYTVRDYFGRIVSEGQTLASESTLTPRAPSGGWEPGWYRVYLTGPTEDALFAFSYGVTNFCVIRDDPHFVTMPDGAVSRGPDEGNDFVMKGVMGLGTSRITIDDVADAAAGITAAQESLGITQTYWTDNGIPDSERTSREAWVAFPYRTIDYTWIHKSGGQSWEGWAAIYPKTFSIDPGDLYLTVEAGTNPNTERVRVYYPNAATLVETWDNIADSATSEAAINAGSTHIWFRGWGGRADPAAYITQQAVGSTYRDSLVDIVQTLYPLGATRFEGPANEPTMTPETAHEMLLFQGAVHAGNASAKAIGPCPVAIPPVFGWTGFLDAGGGDSCDEISFHAYNAVVNGDINLGRHSIQTLKTLLASYGLASKDLWQTESVNAWNQVYGVYHPRRARKALMEWLLFEQLGIPRERNNWWYDRSFGFWSIPFWTQNQDGSLEPQAVLGRVLAEETWGKPFASAVDFGTLGNAMYIGNVYTNAAGESTVAIMATSFMTGASVSLTVSGTTDPIEVVDGFGRQRTMPQSQGRITLPMTDVPVYVRLPTGVSVSVYRINGHSPLGVGVSVSPTATTTDLDGVSYAVIADDGYMTSYPSNAGIAPDPFDFPQDVPSDATLIWSGNKTIERVIVWCGPCWQAAGALTDFAIQTYDGATWTTRKTVTKPTPPYFYFGSDLQNAGCFIETFWDEQWIFDMELDAAVSCQGVRLNVTEASYGGEPLSCPVPFEFGQGYVTQGYKIQEIAVVDANRYAGAAA